MHFLKKTLPLAVALGPLHAFAAPAHGPDNHQQLKDLAVDIVARATTSITPTAATPTPSPSTTETTKTSKPSTTSKTSKTSNACPAAASASTISVPKSKPSGAVQVPGNFIGFGFETAFINDYCSGTFSENLINSIAKRVGETLIIRIGGTSGDRLLVDPSQSKKKVCIDGDCPIGSSATYILGQSYFEGFKRFQNQVSLEHSSEDGEQKLY